MRTAQELFDQCVAFQRKQNEQARDSISCVYISPTGLKCAVGCLLPLSDIDLNKLAGSVSYLTIDYGNILGESLCLEIDTHRVLLSDLQMVHDCCHPIDWEAMWKGITEKHGLKYHEKE